MRFPAWCALLLCAAILHAQDDNSVSRRFLDQEQAAFVHYNAKAWDKAVAAFETQIAIHAHNPRPYYNIACCYGLQGNAQRAATWMRLAISHGWRDLAHVNQDPDFDRVRKHEAFVAAVARLEAIRKLDPDPLPRRMDPDSVPAGDSVQGILESSGQRVFQLRTAEEMLEEGQFRRRLFPVYDFRLAQLTRYAREHGDAREADRAAHARVQTAMLYLVRADGDDPGEDALRRAAGDLVLITAEEFLRSFPGSPLVADVLYWRAFAFRALGKAPEATKQWRAIVRDRPAAESAGRAAVELCILDEQAGDLKALAAGYAFLEKRHAAMERDLRPRLLRARLRAKGLPDAVAALAAGFKGKGPVVYLFVAADDKNSETQLATLRELAKAAGPDGLRVLVLHADRGSDALTAWLEKHAPDFEAQPGIEAARALSVLDVPTLILARGNKVLAVDPEAEELTRLALLDE